MKSTHHRQKGVALVLVLWLVALLTIVAASFSTQSKVESRLAGNAKDALQANLMAQTGFNRAILELMVSDPQSRWNFNGQVYPLETERGEIKIAIRNVSGLLDLNKANRDQLNKLFILLTDDPREREALVDRLNDWRDSDDLRRLLGAEDEDYRAAGYPYITAGQDLKSLEELGYVMGFDADRVNKLRPYVTLNADSAVVDFRFASKELATLLKSSGQLAPELTDALEQLDSELADLDFSQGGGQSQSKVYRIQVDAHTHHGSQARILADVDLRSRGSEPYSIRSWHESL
ncbi:MAG: PilX N-terminal domain-containing pilus assembly protein [Candidatus Thiodiazotropha sp. 4PDIVS1]